jgi:hypothetical protein
MTIRIRDKRTTRRFFVDNVILDVYGEQLGPYGLATYMALCRFADIKEQTCYPSIQTIADTIGAGTSKTRESLRTLEELELIHTEHRPRSSSIYTLLDPPTEQGNATRWVGQRHALGKATPRVAKQSSTNNPHTTTGDAVAEEEETKSTGNVSSALPEALHEDLQAIGFRSDALEERLAAIYQENPDRARALVHWAQQEGQKPAAFLARALQEGWQLPPELEPAEEVPALDPDPACPVCGGLGRLLDKHDEWLICECATIEEGGDDGRRLSGS